MPDLQRCAKCGRKCSINRTGLCFECRRTKCAAPGCNKEFIAQAGNRYCSTHRKPDLEAYLARQNSLVGYAEIRNGGAR